MLICKNMVAFLAVIASTLFLHAAADASTRNLEVHPKCDLTGMYESIAAAWGKHLGDDGSPTNVARLAFNCFPNTEKGRQELCAIYAPFFPSTCEGYVRRNLVGEKNEKMVRRGGNKGNKKRLPQRRPDDRRNSKPNDKPNDKPNNRPNNKPNGKPNGRPNNKPNDENPVLNFCYFEAVDWPALTGNEGKSVGLVNFGITSTESEDGFCWFQSEDYTTRDFRGYEVKPGVVVIKFYEDVANGIPEFQLPVTYHKTSCAQY